MQTKWKKIWMNACIIALCVATCVMEFLEISFTGNAFRDKTLSGILQQTFGGVAMILLMIRSKLRLFDKPKNLLYLLPCMVIAVDNFPFYSYFQGNMQWVRTELIDVVLFALYCLLVGIFEETIFRGILFYAIASRFSNDRKGFIKTYVASSVVFGAAHLMNIFGGNVGAVLLQVGYSTLTGGLFAFALIKTRNIFCAGFVHAVYNFCGLLLSEKGLGTGVVFDVGTGIIMAVISIAIGVFVLINVFRYSEKDRGELYKKLGLTK